MIRKVVSSSFVFILLILPIITPLIVVNVEAQTPFTWGIEVVDSVGDVGADPAIALDSLDRPHISYRDNTNYDLKYAYWTGSTWSVMTVDAVGNVGGDSSIALDSFGNPHISYNDATNGGLKYAYWTGSTWITATVESGYNIGLSTSIALDTLDRPHISYHDNTPQVYSLKYAYWTGSTWSVTTIDQLSNTFTGQSNSIALDSANSPHISYEQNGGSIYRLKYARWTGSTWSTTIVVSSTSLVYATSMSLDSLDRPHISYISDGLKYTYWTGTSWPIEIVDAVGGVQNPSIALDSLDNPHISYSYSYNWGNSHDLKYAWHNGSMWDLETVESAGSGVSGGDYPSIELDSMNRPHIAYFELGGYDLKYATSHVIDFHLTVTPSAQSVTAGSLTNHQVDVTFLSGLLANVSLQLDLPTSVGTYSFTPVSALPNFTSILKIITSSTTPPGTYNLTITAIGKGLIVETTSLNLTISALPLLTLHVTPQEIMEGSSFTASGTLTPSREAVIHLYRRLHEGGEWELTRTFMTDSDGTYSGVIALSDWVVPADYDLLAVMFDETTGDYVTAPIAFLRIFIPQVPVYIRADGSVEGTTYITSGDNITYSFIGNISNNIIIERDHIVIDGAGYTVQGTGSGNGIVLSYRTNVTLNNVHVTNFHFGIFLEHASNNTLASNIASNNYYGIYPAYANNNTLIGNTVSNNTMYGIRLFSANNNTLASNIASNNSGGISLYYTCNHNLLTGNIAINNENGIYFSSASDNTLIGNNVSSNSQRGIFLTYSSDNTLIGNTAFNNNENGILLSSSGNSTLIGNTVFENVNNGIHLSSSSNNTLSGNNVSSNNMYGIYLSSSSNGNVLTGNTASNNYYGIVLESPSNNTLSSNTASKNHYGIVLDSSSNNTLTGNNVSSNTGVGISLGSSSNNTISGNTASNNYYGIYLDSSSNNNVFFHNNLVGNTQQATVSTGTVNTWDDGYPSGGNYWSNYNGTDTDGDGIGDTPYVIDNYNQDNYPLVNAFGVAEYDFNATVDDVTYPVVISSNSSVSEFDFNQTLKKLSFNVTGVNGTAGFCNVSVPEELLGGTFSVILNGELLFEGWDYLRTYNGTHNIFHITYSHSTHKIEILGTEVIPEFNSWLIPVIIMLIATLIIVIFKKKLHKQSLQ